MCVKSERCDVFCIKKNKKNVEVSGILHVIAIMLHVCLVLLLNAITTVAIP